MTKYLNIRCFLVLVKFAVLRYFSHLCVSYILALTDNIRTKTRTQIIHGN